MLYQRAVQTCCTDALFRRAIWTCYAPMPVTDNKHVLSALMLPLVSSPCTLSRTAARNWPGAVRGRPISAFLPHAHGKLGAFGWYTALYKQLARFGSEVPGRARTKQPKPRYLWAPAALGTAQHTTRLGYWLAGWQLAAGLFVVDRPDRPLGEPRAKLLSAGHHLQHGTCRSA